MAGLVKVPVAPGVYWVEAPEAGLRVLCGCPADSVKHLMKRGLIMARELDGMFSETGPNAILLSDVLVQNGAFANLAEFPVLQMLYRQGMLLPGHPNNTGAKPLLIGSEAQVRAQMRYIYRGNYGLATTEELLRAGASPEEARWMMRLKRRFAFGRIRPSEELLDACIVSGHEYTHVSGGVRVRRTALNRFEFCLGKNSVEVDLNLSPGQSYVAPYPLGHHHVRKEYFGVVHSGGGDGWDTERPTMSSLLMFQGRYYCIDAGPNVQHVLTSLGIGVGEVEGVFMTHAHDDHFCGLATLMRAGHRLKLHATPLVRASVARKLADLLGRDEEEVQDFFEVRDLKPEAWNDLESLEVRPVFSPHPVETTILFFRARYAGGWKTYAHMADIVRLSLLRKWVEEDEARPGVSRALYRRVARQYRWPADLKKIDAGGGLIHGEAEDFAADRSDKILLTHLARPLNNREKEIGSGAPFGMVDVLIPGYQDYLRADAFHFLQEYFPNAPRHRLRMLLNQEVELFNPESILIKAGGASDIHLVLSGVVEMLSSAGRVGNRLTAGAMVGEIAALDGAPVAETYRAASYVHALRLPAGLYLDFVKRSGLGDSLRTLQERRAFLQRTWLFGEAVSFPVQNRIAQSMAAVRCEAGKSLAPELSGGLHVLEQGRVVLELGGDALENLGPGDFFGEGCVLFGAPCVLRARAMEPCSLWRVDGSSLLDIPIVRWKLFETNQRRMEQLLNPGLLARPVFQWHDEYRTNVAAMDRQHRELFRMAKDLAVAVEQGGNGRQGQEAVAGALNALIDSTDAHFREEERLMEEHGFPDLEQHRRKHERLLAEVMERRRRLDESGRPDAGFLDFLSDWVVNHILTEDRQYGPYLNSRGIR